MSDIDVVRHVSSALNRGDVDAALELCAAHVEYASRVTAVEGDSYRGHDGVRRWFDDMRESYPGVRAEIDELEDLGGGWVLDRHTTFGRGGASGADLSWTLSRLYEVRDGLIAWAGTFSSRAEALEEYRARTRPVPGPPAS